LLSYIFIYNQYICIVSYKNYYINVSIQKRTPHAERDSLSVTSSAAFSRNASSNLTLLASMNIFVMNLRVSSSVLGLWYRKFILALFADEIAPSVSNVYGCSAIDMTT